MGGFFSQPSQLVKIGQFLYKLKFSWGFINQMIKSKCVVKSSENTPILSLKERVLFYLFFLFLQCTRSKQRGAISLTQRLYSYIKGVNKKSSTFSKRVLLSIKLSYNPESHLFLIETKFAIQNGINHLCRINTFRFMDNYVTNFEKSLF